MTEKKDDYHIIKVPLINTNEDDVLLTEWLVKPWQKVASGDIICILESTKSTFDVESDKSGYLYPATGEGIITKVGTNLAYIFPSNDPKQLRQTEKNSGDKHGRLISRKAKELLKNNKIKINELPGKNPINEDEVLLYLEQRKKPLLKEDVRLKKINVNQKSLLLYCAGDHADVLYETVLSRKDYEVIGFIDYLGKLNIKEKFGIPVFQKDQLVHIKKLGVKNIHINTNSYTLTKKVFKESTELGFNAINLFHASSVISPSAIMGVHIFVGANSVVGTKVKIDDFSKILNGASIAHHSKIGKNCQISDGAKIAGNVLVGNHCLIGLNATVNFKIKIGNNVTIISGVSAYNNIKDNEILRK